MSDNILLMGLPGSGKTVVSKALSTLWQRPVIDIDDDLLEPLWECSVEEKLAKVGVEQFLELEGQAVCSLNVEKNIIALSGSNPLYEKGMKYLCSLGKVIYLKSSFEVVQKFLANMKTGRIVKQPNQSLESAFAYRSQFYERYADAIILIDGLKTPEEIAMQISQLDIVKNLRI